MNKNLMDSEPMNVSTKALKLTSPIALNVRVRVEGNQIIVDRSEFPLKQYPALNNAQLLRDVAAMIETDG